MAFFPSLKHNFIAYRSSKVHIAFLKFTSCDNQALVGIYSNCCCSCSFEPEIIKIGQSSHNMNGNCCILTFGLGKHAIPRWYTGRKWHIPMASNRKRSQGRIWLMKWDKVKSPWYTHRPMYRKRVTSELHDSYFRLMTIKHAIPKIEWAIEWAVYYYITRSRQEVRHFEIRRS